MPSIIDSVYPHFKSSVSEKELAEVYTPTQEELSFVEDFMRKHKKAFVFSFF